MGQAVGDSLPLAIGVAISPVPIISIILMLLSRRAGPNSASFLVGWVLGIAAVLAATVAIAGTATLTAASGPSTGVSWLKVLLGVLLILVGVRGWRRRPKGDQPPSLPRWLTAVEAITPAKAGALGLVLSAANPKNLLLLIAGGVSIDQGASGTGARVAAIVIFTIIGASTVALPVVLDVTMGQRARITLGRMNHWLEANNATVMAVLLTVIGFVLIGKGIGGF